MPPENPYAADLAGREPIAAICESADRYRRLLSSWTPSQFERTYAPGKWTARQILIHLAQTELALGTRARMALSTPNYAAQAFNQDRWMEIESGRPGGSGGFGTPKLDEAGQNEGGLSAREALDALLALMTMNRAFFEGLSAADRAITLS